MKEIVKTSRLAGALEKLYRKLNADFYDNELPMPIITILPDQKAYGHYTKYDAWTIDGETGAREINISSGQLDRPIENICATMLHKMAHFYNDVILHETDTSNGNYYHNGVFKRTAEAHGLICHKMGHYGWSDTSSELSDQLIDWVLTADLPDIRLNRPDLPELPPMTGKTTKTTSKPAAERSRSMRWQCPKCKAIVRSTKQVNVICGDCLVPFMLT